MSRPMFLRAVVIALVTMLAVLPASALGAKPDRSHDHFVDTAENVDVCGVNVDIVAKGVFTDLTFLDKEGNFLQFKGLSSGRVTFTADDGRAVIQHFAGALIEEEIVDEALGRSPSCSRSRDCRTSSGRRTGLSFSATSESSPSRKPTTWIQARSCRSRSSS